MTDNLYLGEDAREGIMRGVRRAAQAVGVTMGTSGSNSLIECLESPGQYATNDGITILQSIRFADPLEEVGRKIILEAVGRANKASGDGSSTTTVLTSAILEEGGKHLSQASPMDIKRSLEACIPVIEKAIKAQTKEVTVENVAQVASISAEDEGIGQMIQTIYQQIGKDGIVHWDVSKTSEDSYSLGQGITVNGATYLSPYMCDIDETGNLTTKVRWKNPKVMLVETKITSAADFNDLFSSLYAKDIREVALFCDEIEVPVISDIVKTRMVRGFKTVVIKMPVLWKDEWWQDLALASGAQLIDGINLSLRNAKEEHLGTFGNLVVTKEDTYIDGIQDLTKHIEELQAEGSDASLLRASRLNMKTARYFVGARSDSALAYRRLKVEDAINAAACALEHGVVPGGGMALLNAIESLPDDVGGWILTEALQEPFRRIVTNAGADPESLDVGREKGFNSRTGKVENLVKKGIVDPADVVLHAVRNAVGVAAAVLTLGTVVLLPRDDKQPL